jgi:hypothetical protein
MSSHRSFKARFSQWDAAWSPALIQLLLDRRHEWNRLISRLRVSCAGWHWNGRSSRLLPAVVVILTSANGRSWNLHHCPSKQVLHGVAYSGDRFIAVGASGTILTSKTGQRWQKQASGTDATLAAIAYGNGTCVIGGDDGLVLSSSDAQTWARQTSGTSRYVGNMVFDREHFVATTGDLHLASIDGSRWQAIDGATVPAGGLSARTSMAVSSRHRRMGLDWILESL